MADQSEDTYGFAEDPSEPRAGRPPAQSRSPRRLSKAAPSARARESEARAKRLREGIAVAVIVGVCVTVAVFMAVRQNVQEGTEQSGFQSIIGDYLFSRSSPARVSPVPGPAKWS
jgi:hypothetical protein